ncbi:hypothetical protein L0Y65_01535 [Candidatus Micrarchaeota archaeon]|nr:hypothetical protein [Candidatus Micrarchaeota archaeon]
MAGPEHVRMGTTTLIIPDRQIGMMGGSRFLAEVRNTLGDTLTVSREELARRSAQVEEMVYAQFRSGNVPDFMRPENFVPVTVERTIGGRRIQATVRVCPDYIAIGSNDDYVLMPVSAGMAQRIASRYGLALPTQMLVDVLDDEAKRTGGYLPFVAAPQLAEQITNPHTNRPVIDGEAGHRWNFQKYGHYEGRWMLSGEFIGEQNRRITEARGRAGNPQGIRSGHKKDVVYDQLNFFEAKEGGQPVVIYHRGIQGLSNWHNVGYLDYSHGIRLVDQDVTLRITEANGSVHTETRRYSDILNDPQLYRLVSNCRVDTSQLYRGVDIPLQAAPPPRARAVH